MTPAMTVKQMTLSSTLSPEMKRSGPRFSMKYSRLSLSKAACPKMAVDISENTTPTRKHTRRVLAALDRLKQRAPRVKIRMLLSHEV